MERPSPAVATAGCCRLACALPIELPTIVNFVINLQTAQELGDSVPESILLRATDVIQ